MCFNYKWSYDNQNKMLQTLLERNEDIDLGLYFYILLMCNKFFKENY